MNELQTDSSAFSEFVEVDPTGRYGRYNEILGKGASKTVYRAFDEYQGIEVAWNQVKLYDFLQSPEDLERLYCEIHLLKTLKHKNIMKFYTSWVDTANRNINFVTEMFTSGTLRQYRQKHKRVNIRAVKHWCRQILRGLHYLHSHDPPVIHRDLKCDNIFVNGNQGEVKIGDLGLAAILRKSHAAHCVGTPEFMAPEVYEESYNELVDIYSFGMCVLEMVTFEYPYSECSHPAQIYKKVISGKKPEALYKVKDPEVREFVEKCLATVSLRLSARELLDDPFLQIDDYEYDLGPVESGAFDGKGPIIHQPFFNLHRSYSNMSTEHSNCFEYEGDWISHPVEIEPNGIELFKCRDDDEASEEDVDISIKGKKKDDGGIFLRLRIADKEGHIRNIYFPFDIEMDTALSVATEMVAELDITDQDVTSIADMIDGEIASLVPEWKPGPGIEEPNHFVNNFFCHNCVSNDASGGSIMDFHSHNQVGKNSQLPQCCRHGCTSMHGRFEEITFPSEYDNHVRGDTVTSIESNQPESQHYQELWNHQESCELSSVESDQSHSDEQYEQLDKSVLAEDKGKGVLENKFAHDPGNPPPSLSGNYLSTISLLCPGSGSEYEIEVQQELRWLKAKLQMESRDLRDKRFGAAAKSSSHSSNKVHKTEQGIVLPLTETVNGVKNGIHLKPLCNFWDYDSSYRSLIQKSHSNLDIQSLQNCEVMCSHKEGIIRATAKSFYTGSLRDTPYRTVSLPVDAVDI
ncbi:hypothetical protein VIGAN_05141300 [Vigna angularis var. angularis]|uniref:non-specific serine/threonine protein kinase n=1 Tax=Vigna angularis var. angularis TaxID=157739 RepID=A0A0S3S578_PHAAN|nr:probable serine/threonine-protein kinase WNK9 isoform X1 [Vigna angularis]BAT87988.1 hypothetical protein VIGAN_05141300 [Vigna angularis var. angularis]